jgi:hypothetical protein
MLTDAQYNQVLSGFVVNNPYREKQFKKPLRFPSVRIGFLRHHKKSLHQRWFFNQRNRRNIFPGSVIAYLLCL